MPKFCVFCGKRLDEGEVCSCQSSDGYEKKIFQKESKPNLKLFAKLSLLATILCFFLPAFMVSCAGKKVTMSTFSLMTGSGFKEISSFMGSSFSGAQFMAFLVMALGVAALALLFVNLQEKLVLLPVFCSAGGFLMSLVLFIGILVKMNGAAKGEDLLEIQCGLEPGAYLIILFYIISAVLCYLSIAFPVYYAGYGTTADAPKSTLDAKTHYTATREVPKYSPDDYVPSVPMVSKMHVFSEKEAEPPEKEPASGLKSTMRNRDADGESTAQPSDDAGKKYYRAPDDFD